MLRLEWGDAQIWMSVAEEFCFRNAKNPRNFLRDRAGSPKTNEMNVAAVCAGYAFELLFKVLVKAAGGKPRLKHPPRDAYNKLNELGDGEVRAEVGRIIADHGRNEPIELLEYIDDLCHRDRKYWMRPKDDTRRGTSVIHVGGR